MNDNEKRISIAEACGWKRIEHEFFSEWIAPNGETNPSLSPPDYLTDLNAMHEAEKALPKDMKTDYVRHLNKGDFANYRLAFATAAQRAEAFLKTLNLWTTHPTKGPK